MSSELEFSGNGGDEFLDVAEDTVKINRSRRKKSTENEEAEEGHWHLQQLQNPLNVLGSDIMHKILSYLDGRGVAQSILVSRGWHEVASSDSLWSSKCEELWLGKAHIPRMSRAQGLSKLHAYSLSVKDSKRTQIMKDDLCDHVWELRFRETVPQRWRNLDPYWTGTGQPMLRYFHRDGSITADPGDRVWGGHEASYSVLTDLEGNGEIRGHYVRINRWPPLSSIRKQDWSWEMSNHLVYYSSNPDPEKEDGTGPLFV